MEQRQTIYRRICGERTLISSKDFLKALPENERRDWYAINSHPEYVTHKIIDGVPVEIENARQKFFS